MENFKDPFKVSGQWHVLLDLKFWIFFFPRADHFAEIFPRHNWKQKKTQKKKERLLIWSKLSSSMSEFWVIIK